MAGTRNQEVVQILTCLFPPPALSHRGACLQVGCPLGTCPAVETRAHHFGSARNCTASLLSQRPRWFLSFCLNWQYFGKRFSRDEVMSCTELVICCFDFLSHSRISEAVGVWGTHLQALKKKKKIALKTMLLKCLLICWDAALYAASSLTPRCHMLRVFGWGAQAWEQLHLWIYVGFMLTCAPRRTCSFCFVYWKHENYIFGRRVSKQSYKKFSFGFIFFLKKKRCKIECMFTCPRSKVLNTKVTICWMDPPLGALLSSGNWSSCPLSLPVLL